MARGVGGQRRSRIGAEAEGGPEIAEQTAAAAQPLANTAVDDGGVLGRTYLDFSANAEKFRHISDAPTAAGTSLGGNLPLTDNLDTVEVEGATIQELLTGLDTRYPGIGERLLDAQGNVRRFVNIYVNGEDVRFLQDKETPVKSGDEVSIVPAIAGG